MDTKWLEDFISLANTRSFRRAGEQRHVTQSAFSRRIQNLEDWAGVELFNRTHPLELTPAGEILHRTALKVLQTQAAARSALRHSLKSAHDLIEFAVSECLAGSYLLDWMGRWEAEIGPVKCRFVTFDHLHAKEFIDSRYPDFVLTPHHVSSMNELGREQYEHVTLEQIVLRPYTKCGYDGQPLHILSAAPAAAVPYLAYREKSYLDELINSHCGQDAQVPRLDRIFESDSAEDLKSMAMHGHGVCFLARKMVEGEVQSGQLSDAAPHRPDMSVHFELRLYRPRRHTPAATVTVAERIWRTVVANQA